MQNEGSSETGPSLVNGKAVAVGTQDDIPQFLIFVSPSHNKHALVGNVPFSLLLLSVGPPTEDVEGGLVSFIGPGRNHLIPTVSTLDTIARAMCALPSLNFNSAMTT